MPEEVINTSIANLDKAQLLEEIKAIEADIAEVEKIRPVVEVNLPKVEERLLAIHANVDAIKEKEAKMAALAAPLDSIEQGVKDIAYYARFSAEVLAFIQELDQGQKYDDALAAVESLRTRYLTLDYGLPLASQKAIFEIIGHEKACLYAHKGEAHILQGEPALTEEELGAYDNLAQGLGTSIDGEKSRHFHMDKVIGFRYDVSNKYFAAQEPSNQLFLDMVACDNDLSKGGLELSELTLARQEAFRRLILTTYNAQATAAFQGDDYEEALFYYEHRDFVDEALIEEEAYRLPNSTEFHFAFILAKAVAKNDDEFYDFLKSLREDLLKEDEFTVALVGHLLACPGISDSHFELLLSELKKTNFEIEVICFAQGILAGMSEERQFSVLNVLLHEKKKRGDIEKMGKALYTIRENIVDSQKKEYNGLLKDLLRSPHAKRAATKSGSPAIHALLGEDFNNPKLPIGKREKKPLIKSWDFVVAALYYCFLVILPIGLCIGTYPILIALQMDTLIKRLVLIAPLVIGTFFGMMAIVRRHGFDERGAEAWGIGLGTTGILLSALAFVYFFMPDTLSVLATYGYSILGLGATLGVASLFLKQRKRGVRIALTFPLVAFIVAAAVFIALDLMNGKI